MKVIKIWRVDAKIVNTHGTGVAIEFEILAEDTSEGKFYNLRIPKLLDLREDLEWYYPEIFKAKRSPEVKT